MNLEDIMLSEISLSQKGTILIVPIRDLKKSISYRQKVEWWLPETGGMGNGKLVFNGHNFN